MTSREFGKTAGKVLGMINEARRRLDIAERYTHNAIRKAKEGNAKLGYYLLYAPLFALENGIPYECQNKARKRYRKLCKELGLETVSVDKAVSKATNKMLTDIYGG